MCLLFLEFFLDAAIELVVERYEKIKVGSKSGDIRIKICTICALKASHLTKKNARNQNIPLQAWYTDNEDLSTYDCLYNENNGQSVRDLDEIKKASFLDNSVHWY